MSDYRVTKFDNENDFTHDSRISGIFKALHKNEKNGAKKKETKLYFKVEKTEKELEEENPGLCTFIS